MYRYRPVPVPVPVPVVPAHRYRSRYTPHDVVPVHTACNPTLCATLSGPPQPPTPSESHRVARFDLPSKPWRSERACDSPWRAAGHEFLHIHLTAGEQARAGEAARLYSRRATSPRLRSLLQAHAEGRRRSNSGIGKNGPCRARRWSRRPRIDCPPPSQRWRGPQIDCPLPSQRWRGPQIDCPLPSQRRDAVGHHPGRHAEAPRARPPSAP